MSDLEKQLANGQTNPEYVTVILELCGIKEEWHLEGEWISSAKDLRQKLETLIQLVKSRTVKNVLDNQESTRIVSKFPKVLEGLQNKVKR